jgi:hypothetical protein
MGCNRCWSRSCSCNLNNSCNNGGSIILDYFIQYCLIGPPKYSHLAISCVDCLEGIILGHVRFLLLMSVKQANNNKKNGVSASSVYMVLQSHIPARQHAPECLPPYRLSHPWHFGKTFAIIMLCSC